MYKRQVIAALTLAVSEFLVIYNNICCIDLLAILIYLSLIHIYLSMIRLGRTWLAAECLSYLYCIQNILCLFAFVY